MKKLLYLLPLLLGVFACQTQAQPATNVADMVNATLTSIAQSNPQGIAPLNTGVPPIVAEAQLTATQSLPLPTDSFAPTGSITYFWPRTMPEGFILSREISNANENGFTLTFINPSSGAISLFGGADVVQTCDNSGEPVIVRGMEGCFPPSTGGGFTVVWKENDTYYSVGGMGVSKESAISIAEQLEIIDLSTFLARLGP